MHRQGVTADAPLAYVEARSPPEQFHEPPPHARGAARRGRPRCLACSRARRQGDRLREGRPVATASTTSTRPAISGKIDKFRQVIAEQRKAGKAVGYLSCR